MVVKTTEKGVEVFPGITVPWDWIDGILCGIIEKGEDGIIVLVDGGVDKLEAALQALVDNNSLKFDNVGKKVLCRAVTLAFVKRYMPELLPSP